MVNQVTVILQSCYSYHIISSSNHEKWCSQFWDLLRGKLRNRVLIAELLYKIHIFTTKNTVTNFWFELKLLLGAIKHYWYHCNTIWKWTTHFKAFYKLSLLGKLYFYQAMFGMTGSRFCNVNSKYQLIPFQHHTIWKWSIIEQTRLYQSRGWLSYCGLFVRDRRIVEALLSHVVMLSCVICPKIVCLLSNGIPMVPMVFTGEYE